MTNHFISSEIYRGKGYSPAHPLGIERVGAVLNLCEHLGWIARPDETAQDSAKPYITSPAASIAELEKFHTPDYIRAIIKAEKEKSVPPEWREKYNIGTMENPIFEGLFERASTSVGGSIHSARLAAQMTQGVQKSIAYHPSGGTHHGMPDHASGFCYFNDPVFAILTFLESGIEKVLYVDLDAHHGDGVEAAFANDDRVFLLSVHEENRWPYTGTLENRSMGRKSGNSRNMPVPRRFNDSEMDYLMSEAVLPLAERFRPQAMVITCGADGLYGDPLSAMELSNSCLWDAVMALSDLVPSSVIVGGGGYNPWTTSRCWAGLWGRIEDKKMPEKLPAASQALLKNFECDLVDEDEMEDFWLTTLVDPRNDGAVRDRIGEIVKVVTG